MAHTRQVAADLVGKKPERVKLLGQRNQLAVEAWGTRPLALRFEDLPSDLAAIDPDTPISELPPDVMRRARELRVVREAAAAKEAASAARRSPWNRFSDLDVVLIACQFEMMPQLEDGDGFGPMAAARIVYEHREKIARAFERWRADRAPGRPGGEDYWIGEIATRVASADGRVPPVPLIDANRVGLIFGTLQEIAHGLAQDVLDASSLVRLCPGAEDTAATYHHDPVRFILVNVTGVLRAIARRAEQHGINWPGGPQ